MNEDLLNVMGSFSEISLDCLEKQNEEIEQLEKENADLKKQLEYLRSGEYLNQLKFERNMLEDIVQNMEVSKEDKEFIDMTHRNTELLEENQQLKEELKKLKQPTIFIDTQDMEERYGEGLYMDYLKEENQELKNRINKAVEYMKPRFMNCINNDKRYFEDNDIQEIYEILKEDNKENDER